MQTSNERNASSGKKEWGKLLAVVLAFCVLVVGGSYAVIRCYYTQFRTDYNMVFLGASNTYYGVDPRVIDSETGANSVNLASALSSFESRYALLENMLETQPVQTVVLDVSYDALTLDMQDWPFERELPVIMQFPAMGDGMRYCSTRQAGINDYELLYKNYMAKGTETILKKCLGKPGTFEATKGFEGATATVLYDPEQPVPAKGEKGGVPTNYLEDNIRWLEKMVRLCQEKQVRVVLHTVPMSENMIWSYNGWDTFHEEITALAAEWNCEYYDFNLLKDRQEWFSDVDSFSDLSHLSEQGAQVYSRMLGQYLKEAGTDSSNADAFYSSYEEASTHFVYNR